MTAAAVLAAVTVAEAIAIMALYQALRSQARQHARQVDMLLDRVMHLTGQTWTPPPAGEKPPATQVEPVRRHYTQTPEQLPVH